MLKATCRWSFHHTSTVHVDYLLLFGVPQVVIPPIMHSQVIYRDDPGGHSTMHSQVIYRDDPGGLSTVHAQSSCRSG